MLKHIFLLLTFISLSISAYAVEPETCDFAVVEGDTLRLDIYSPETPGQQRAAVIFAFGGAFRGGARNNPEYRQYLDFLAENGIVAISIDYRTTLEKDPGLLKTPAGTIKAFTDAITDAVSDFQSATSYVVRNAGKLGIDPEKIIASGSSAGAITALQSEYSLCNGESTILPEGFKYAGVISFAGAILSADTLKWTMKPCPMQLYHGDKDHNVPFAALSVGPVSLCGSERIAESLDSIAVPCEFFIYSGADHRISVSPMEDNLYDILGFVRRIAAGKERLSVTARIGAPGAPLYPTEEITIEDIIKANL